MDLYEKYQRSGRSLNGEYAFTTTDDGTDVLATAKASTWLIRIQRLRVTIKTSAAQTITFQDSTTGKFVEKTDSDPGANTQYIWDFGPKGHPLTIGENFVAVFSAAGLAGHIEWEAYQKQ